MFLPQALDFPAAECYHKNMRTRFYSFNAMEIRGDSHAHLWKMKRLTLNTKDEQVLLRAVKIIQDTI